MGESRGRGKQRNTNRGLMGTDNRGGDRLWELGEDRAEESNGEKGVTTVTEQQKTLKL